MIGEALIGDGAALVEALAQAAQEAGEAILTIVRRGFDVESKGDSSPVTEADRTAELVILAALARAAPGVPVIAEEEVAAGRIPDHGSTYFLVDPLDGTKEFIRGGDDYTVNIGLIEEGSPSLGVVYAPATGTLFGGRIGDGAWREDGQGRSAAGRSLRMQPGDARSRRAAGAARSTPSRRSRISPNRPSTISHRRSASAASCRSAHR